MPRVDNTEFYNASIKKYKQTAKGVHWASRGRQLVRFEIFKILLEKELPQSSVVDAGCGFGDLYSYLKRENCLPLNYIGIDAHQKMVNISRKETKQTILHADVLHDELPQADYYLCSGAMNILKPFETILFIHRMLESSEKGVIFNLLKGDNNQGDYNKYRPEAIRNMLSFFEGSIEIFEDYLDDDFTVFMKKSMD